MLHFDGFAACLVLLKAVFGLLEVLYMAECLIGESGRGASGPLEAVAAVRVAVSVEIEDARAARRVRETANPQVSVVDM